MYTVIALRMKWKVPAEGKYLQILIEITCRMKIPSDSDFKYLQKVNANFGWDNLHTNKQYYLLSIYCDYLFQYFIVAFFFQ